MENDSNSKSSPSLSEDSFDDASSRRTIALDLVESTPAPAHFRTLPSASGAGEYSWAARVDKLTLRLDKLQLRVEALEDSFADPDDPTKEELDNLAPLQRARESLLVELRAVDIHLHILPAPRQPRRPSLYIGTIPGNGRL